MKVNESLFNKKITVSTESDVIEMKVDILKYHTFIEIRLIELENIKNIYICTISEPEFDKIKQEQDITVNYDLFIEKLPMLFYELVINNYQGEFKGGNLRFIKVDDFRTSCMLKLPFKPAEPAQFNRFLGEIIGGLESDNVKLYKEVKYLRSRVADGDKAQNERIRRLSMENEEYKERANRLSNEINSLENRFTREISEYKNTSQKYYDLESVNRQLNLEIEKYKLENPEATKKLLEEKNDEILRIKRELESINQMNKQIIDENRHLIEYKRKSEDSAFESNSIGQTYKSKYEDEVNRNMMLKEKYKAYDNMINDNKIQIENLIATNKELKNKLESAQNVYSHFYNKKIGGSSDTSIKFKDELATDEDDDTEKFNFPEFKLNPDNNL